MDLSTPSRVVLVVGAYVRRRLTRTVGPLAAPPAAPLAAPLGRVGLDRPSLHDDGSEASTNRATVVVIAPAATFAPTSPARTRLLRQLRASGMLGRDPR
jgi:hypothetical protein